MIWKKNEFLLMSSFDQWSIQKQGLFYNGLSMEGALRTHKNGIHSKNQPQSFYSYLPDEENDISSLVVVRYMSARRHRWPRNFSRLGNSTTSWFLLQPQIC